MNEELLDLAVGIAHRNKYQGDGLGEPGPLRALAEEISYRHLSRLALRSSAAALIGHIPQDQAAGPFQVALSAYDTAVSVSITVLIDELRLRVVEVCVPGLMSQLLPDIFPTGPVDS